MSLATLAEKRKKKVKKCGKCGKKTKNKIELILKAQIFTQTLVLDGTNKLFVRSL